MAAIPVGELMFSLFHSCDMMNITTVSFDLHVS